MLFRVMEALNRVPAELRILACPEDSLNAFKAPAEEAGFEIFAGSKENVLSRYCGVIRKFKLDRVIRATADNPFVFTDAAEEINREALELEADYAGYTALPHGAGVESVKSEALLRAERDARRQSDLEHVCPYLYTHPDFFLLHRPLAPRSWQGPALQITVDTPDDLERAEKLYALLSALYPGPERYRGAEIIRSCQKIAENREGLSLAEILRGFSDRSPGSGTGAPR
jgi:spore coat polysaccharide biosynthesis protein SpsF